jgi:uncharacterized protein with HEPN domain
MPPDPHRVQLADRIRLQHMLDAARAALRFMHNRSRADLDTDELLARAVMHAIQEIGEAASRTSETSRARVPDVPWTKIVGMRHRLVHVYWGVNMNLVHEVIIRDLPPLIKAIESGIANWPLPRDDAP